MVPQSEEFERIRTVLEERADEPLTAREIREYLSESGEDSESAHRIATILGQRARTGDVDVIESKPYRYRIR
jgi:predicted Zn-ribbon and HTH transcriptional regulator